MRNNKGFSAAIAIVIVIFIFAAGGVGYWYYAKHNTNTSDNANANDSNTNQNSANGNTLLQNLNQQNTNAVLQNTNARIFNNSSSNINVATNANLSITNTSNGFDTELLEQMSDVDGDTLFKVFEEIYGTNPALADTDGDGYDDSTEIKSCHNPLATGKMSVSYYSDVFCRNIATYTLQEENLTEEKKSVLIEQYVGLCKDWSGFAEDVFSIEKFGNSYEAISTMSHPSYADACNKTKDKYNSNQITELLEFQQPLATNAEGYCLEFSDYIKYICGPEALTL